MSNLKTWDRVADQSRLLMSLEVPANKIATGRVIVVDDESSETIFEDSAVRPGPAEMKLSKESSHYSVRATLSFGEKCTVTFRAEIRKPDSAGSRHGKPFEMTVEGKKGAVVRPTMICNMQQ